jgi:hypothetical protein
MNLSPRFHSHFAASVWRMMILAVVPLLAIATQAGTINFDDGSVSAGATLSNQYTLSLGVTFVPGTGGATGVINPTVTTQGFSSATDMTIVSFTGGDIGGGATSPISGLLLHSFNGWLGEDGDPVFRINFAQPISSFSIVVGGVSDLGSTAIYGINGSNVAVQSTAATTTTTSTLSLSFATPVSSIVLTEGDFDDWVGVDNIQWTLAAVPEPATNVMVVLGSVCLAVAAVRRRRRA